MVAETTNVEDCLACNGGENAAKAGVVATSEWKVLPDEDTERVAYFIEGGVLVYAATPDSAQRAI